MTGATFFGNQTHIAMKNAFRLLLLVLLPLFCFSACKGGGDTKEPVAAVDALHPFEGGDEHENDHAGLRYGHHDDLYRPEGRPH